MKIRVSYTVEIDENFRRAWRAYYGKSGLATRKELKEHFEKYGGLIDDDILTEFENKKTDVVDP